MCVASKSFWISACVLLGISSHFFVSIIRRSGDLGSFGRRVCERCRAVGLLYPFLETASEPHSLCTIISISISSVSTKIVLKSGAHCTNVKSSTPYLLEFYVALEFWKLQGPS